jgi:hypothetical protein
MKLSAFTEILIGSLSELNEGKGANNSLDDRESDEEHQEFLLCGPEWSCAEKTVFGDEDHRNNELVEVTG